MSTITKSRTNFISVFKSLFSSEIDVDSIDDTKLPEELNEAWKAVSNQEKNVEQAINVASSSSKRGGFAKVNPIKNAGTEKAMRVMHKEVQKSEENRERD